MPHRYQIESDEVWRPRFPVFTALRETFRRGYGLSDLRADAVAGIVVGIVALPLSMAFAIAAGAPPQYGLYTAIVGGIVIAACGGAPFSVSGPSAAFAVLAPISHQYGVGGLLIATMMAGVILLLMGVSGLGRLVQYIPYPVTMGFTAGIAVVIATLQIKDFFGLTLIGSPQTYLARVEAISRALPTINPPDLAIGAMSLAILLIWPKLTRKAPAPLVATAAGAVVAFALHKWAPELKVATVGNRFSYMLGGVSHGGIPPLPPLPIKPWSLPGPDGQPIGLSLDLARRLLGPSVAIMMLGAIESMLCAVVSDGMKGTKHNPDGELIAQGLGNIISPLFGGISATGAMARTATSIKAGARSPIAAIVHSLFILVAVLILAPLLAWLPMASMAALLLIVAWNMSGARHFAHILRVAPRGDVAVLLTCFSLTIILDMAVAVSVGVVFASLLFMDRMATVSSGRVFEGKAPHLARALPADTLLYEIAGPLFFGAAEKAVSALQGVAGPRRRVILDLSSVPAMDVSGLVALESIFAKLRSRGTLVILSGVRSQPARVLAKAGFAETPGELIFTRDLEDALSRIEPAHAAGTLGAAAPAPSPAPAG